MIFLLVFMCSLLSYAQAMDNNWGTLQNQSQGSTKAYVRTTETGTRVYVARTEHNGAVIFSGYKTHDLGLGNVINLGNNELTEELWDELHTAHEELYALESSDD